MKNRMTMPCVGFVVASIIGLTGCGIWPVMTEENGRHPFAMGKSDVLLFPGARQPVHLSEWYGNSYRYALETQILNPQSANSLKVVEGLGGGPAQRNMARYEKMFKKPPFFQKASGGGGNN